MDSITPHSADQFIQLSGPLFEAVQRSDIFPDSKTFVDSIPKSDPKEILRQFNEQKQRVDFDLPEFVQKHFKLPESDDKKMTFKPADDMESHINQLWEHLSRQPDDEASSYSSLIPLPYPYIVPGGRFREIYYWDTYFTAEGLAASGRMDMVKSLSRNFSWLIEKAGHIPNGNRYYYLSRSQPPFFVMLVDLIARHEDEEAIQEFLPALKKEYAFWMDGALKLNSGQAHRRLVNIDGHLLNRYWDDRTLPRQESWREDKVLAKELNPHEAAQRYRDLRAGAESGWDYSSRWFRDGQSLDTIHTTEILPVDLNALLYFMESKLAEWSTGKESKKFIDAAQDRKKAFDRFFWNANNGFFFDYDGEQQKQTSVWSMAGAYPLFTGIASQQQADATAQILKEKFLKAGGLVTTLNDTGQQWDSPNGWAPLQWIGIRGLMRYDHQTLANDIAERWLKLNESVFNRTGKMMEKYNVCDLSLEGGGGEYPLQDGFGWTNGVAIALKKLLAK